jgi:hypothetical protein
MKVKDTSSLRGFIAGLVAVSPMYNQVRYFRVVKSMWLCYRDTIECTRYLNKKVVG